jgi:hypothetical protein
MEIELNIKNFELRSIKSRWCYIYYNSQIVKYNIIMHEFIILILFSLTYLWGQKVEATNWRFFILLMQLRLCLTMSNELVSYSECLFRFLIFCFTIIVHYLFETRNQMRYYRLFQYYLCFWCYWMLLVASCITHINWSIRMIFTVIFWVIVLIIFHFIHIITIFSQVADNFSCISFNLYANYCFQSLIFHFTSSKFYFIFISFGFSQQNLLSEASFFLSRMIIFCSIIQILHIYCLFLVIFWYYFTIYLFWIQTHPLSC